MQAFHPGTGMTLEFPDNTPDEDIQQHFMNAQSNMPTTAPSVAQQFIDGARGAYEQQQLSPAPVNGAGFVGLDPQQAQFMLQQRQNAAALQQRAASDNAQNRLQQQKLEQDELEGEKNRATTISLATQRMKNDIAIDKAQAAAAAHAEKMKELGRQADNKHDLDLEALRLKNDLEIEGARIQGRKEVAGMRASSNSTKGPETVIVPMEYTDPDTNEVFVVNTLVNKQTGETIRELGNAPSNAGGGKRGGSSSGGNADIVEGSNEYSTAIHDRAKMIIENQVPVDGVPKISVAEAYEQAEKIVREENSLSPWGENDVARRNAVQSKQVEFYSVEEAKFTSKFGASPQTPAAQAYIQRQAQLQAEKWALEQEGFIAEIEGEKLYKRGK